MYTEAIAHWSRNLGKEMHMRIYGQGGVPFLGFPTQNSMCGNYEDFGMTGQLADYIDGGQIRLFTVDSVDAETWSNENGDNAWRARRQEMYYRYIADEVLPFMRSRSDSLPVVTGMSMGANHAANLFLRRPELFRGVVALSGVYDSDYFFHGWMDATLYENSPERFLPNMPPDHPYVELYNRKRMIFCVGQGAWEEDGVRTLRHLERVFREKGIHAWCDFWGSDVNHDWPWWYRQMRYFVAHILNDKQA